MWKVGSSLEKGQSLFTGLKRLTRLNGLKRSKTFEDIVSFEYERVSNTDKIQILMNAG